MKKKLLLFLFFVLGLGLVKTGWAQFECVNPTDEHYIVVCRYVTKKGIGLENLYSEENCFCGILFLKPHEKSSSWVFPVNVNLYSGCINFSYMDCYAAQRRENRWDLLHDIYFDFYKFSEHECWCVCSKLYGDITQAYGDTHEEIQVGFLELVKLFPGKSRIESSLSYYNWIVSPQRGSIYNDRHKKPHVVDMPPFERVDGCGCCCCNVGSELSMYRLNVVSIKTVQSELLGSPKCEGCAGLDE